MSVVRILYTVNNWRQECMAKGRHDKPEEFNVRDASAGVDNVEDYKERFLLYCAENRLDYACKHASMQKAYLI